MTTDIPESLLMPNEVETRLGTLRFTDGFPDEATAQKVYDQMDFQRAVEAVMLTMPGASVHAIRESMRTWGPDNQTACIWADRMDSKVILLTPNTTVVYLFMWLDTKGGPLVMETPPNVLGIIDDHWFRYVGDFGNAGPDRGKGGQYLLLPPGYEGREPSGYRILHSPTFGNWLICRGYLVDGDPGPGTRNIKDHLRVYQLAQSANPPAMNFVDVSGKAFNTVHAMDQSYFEEINEIVQEEPNEAQVPEVLGMLDYIGITKGQPFAPDARMKKILTEAAYVAHAASRTILYRNRHKSYAAYPNSGWETGFPGGSHEFILDGIRKLDQRIRFHFFATGITPAMVIKMVGKGSQYMMGLRDSEGRALDGGKNYKLHIPPDVPMKDFWDVTIYDVQTRSLLQTDQRFPGVTSADKEVVLNPDGSCDIYFGPQRPGGKKVNWLQTVPGKGWHSLFRLYGPLEPWFDKTWRPGEVELVD
ncbi:MAG: DUF1254 domain-containing protein [Bacteroidota bacterium]